MDFFFILCTVEKFLALLENCNGATYGSLQ